MLRFLVIGASGLVGKRFCRKLGPELTVGTYGSRAVAGQIRFDLTTDTLTDVLSEAGGRFSHALILGAITEIDVCAREPVKAARVNVDGTIRVMDSLHARGIVPIFASTDAVYDGNHGGWREDDPANPILTYGRHKLAAEHHLAKLAPPWIALRIAKVLDPELHAKGLLGPWIWALRTGEKIRCATDQRFSPVGIDDVVSAIVRLAAADASGIFNLGGAEPISRFDLLTMLVSELSHLQAVTPEIKTCGIRDFDFAEARPIDTSLSIERLKSTISFTPESLSSICARAVARSAARRDV